MTKYITAVLLLCAAPCLADVKLPKILASSMVLQRDSDVKLWGWADAGEAVRVECDWLNATTSTKADADGKWQATIKTGAAGGPHKITIEGKNRIALDNILFGEVWIASGQSNMEMPLAKVSGAYTGIENAEREIAEAKHPQIRLFQVGNFSSKEPLDDVEAGVEMYGVPPSACKWQVCTPESIPTFAATAYFFARELQRELKVPVGIVDASWGGTAAEPWVPTEGFKAIGGYAAELEQAAKLPQQADQKIPTRLYNGMIHPLRNLKIRGFLWYQGEGNTTTADKYHKLFSTMIEQWRKAFGEELPFYFVQIAPFNYNGVNAAYLREAQLATLSLPKTRMVVTMDIGNLTDIHPKNKQEVGRRLALCALADAGREIVCSGPIYRESEFKDGKARIAFDHVGGGLAGRDDKPFIGEFEIAGADKVFHRVTTIARDGDSLVISSDKVPDPKAVRYAFKSNSTPYLMNKEGLPASSFRTDRW